MNSRSRRSGAVCGQADGAVLDAITPEAPTTSLSIKTKDATGTTMVGEATAALGKRVSQPSPKRLAAGEKGASKAATLQGQGKAGGGAQSAAAGKKGVPKAAASQGQAVVGAQSAAAGGRGVPKAAASQGQGQAVGGAQNAAAGKRGVPKAAASQGQGQAMGGAQSAAAGKRGVPKAAAPQGQGYPVGGAQSAAAGKKSAHVAAAPQGQAGGGVGDAAPSETPAKIESEHYTSTDSEDDLLAAGAGKGKGARKGKGKKGKSETPRAFWSQALLALLAQLVNDRWQRLCAAKDSSNTRDRADMPIIWTEIMLELNVDMVRRKQLRKDKSAVQRFSTFSQPQEKWRQLALDVATLAAGRPKESKDAPGKRASSGTATGLALEDAPGEDNLETEEQRYIYRIISTRAVFSPSHVVGDGQGKRGKRPREEGDGEGGVRPVKRHQRAHAAAGGVNRQLAAGFTETGLDETRAALSTAGPSTQDQH